MGKLYRYSDVQNALYTYYYMKYKSDEDTYYIFKWCKENIGKRLFTEADTEYGGYTPPLYEHHNDGLWDYMFITGEFFFVNKEDAAIFKLVLG